MSTSESSPAGVINMTFGTPPGLTPGQFQVLHLTLSACIGLIACVLVQRYIKLSHVSISFLWILYYVVGLVFHLCSWLAGDAQTYAFLGLTLVHVYVEGLLCIKVLERKAAVVNGWASLYSTYFCGTALVGLLLWQPLNVFFLGSFLALPVDILVWPAAMAMRRRSQDASIRRLSWVWALNAPIVCTIFAMIVWGAKTENNYAGITTLALQLQYIVMGVCWIQAFGKLDASRVGVSSLEEAEFEGLGILPTSKHGSATDATSEESRPLISGKRGGSSGDAVSADGGMENALQATLFIVSFVFVVAVIAPLALGKIDLSMMVTNACQTFRPGNVQVLSNLGPNFVVPIACQQ